MKQPHRTYRKLLTAPRVARVAVGLALVAGGLFGFLPVLGFWMIPLGLVVILFEMPWIRHLWRRTRAWWKNRHPNQEGPA